MHFLHREPFACLETRLQSIQPAVMKGENIFSKSFQVGEEKNNLTLVLSLLWTELGQRRAD